MDLIDKLVAFFQRPESETQGQAPEGLCPVCWGYQEYDGKIREIIRDRQIDVNNHRQSYMFLQEFVREHIVGFELRDPEVVTCPTCGGDLKRPEPAPAGSGPIKRHERLQPLSREHHDALLLCWKIRTGLKKEVDPMRMKRYVDWFWESHLKPHFEAEELHVFPLLGQGDTRVQRAISDHRRLERLITEDTGELTEILSEVERTLNDHIRFEERVLFNAIQESAGPEELEALSVLHDHGSACGDWGDEFWK